MESAHLKKILYSSPNKLFSKFELKNSLFFGGEGGGQICFGGGGVESKFSVQLSLGPS